MKGLRALSIFGILFLFSGGIGYKLGYSFAEKQYLESIGQQAVIDIHRDLNLLATLGDSASPQVRSEIDLNIQRHLISVVRYTADEPLGQSSFKARTLSRLADVWTRYPPFQTADMIGAKQTDPLLAKSMSDTAELVMRYKKPTK